MKYLITILTLSLLSCRPAYELQAKSLWFEVLSIETKERLGREDELRVHCISSNRVAYFIDVRMGDSLDYVVGKKYKAFMND